MTTSAALADPSDASAVAKEDAVATLEGNATGTSNGSAEQEQQEQVASDSSSERNKPRKTSGEHWKAVQRNVKMSLEFSRGFDTLRDMCDDQLITPDRIRKIQVLGEGAFATVEKAKLLYDGGGERLVAVKSLRPEVLQSKRDIESFATEVQLLRRLRHRYK